MDGLSGGPHDESVSKPAGVVECVEDDLGRRAKALRRCGGVTARTPRREEAPTEGLP
jgi:hypothetical protein